MLNRREVLKKALGVSVGLACLPSSAAAANSGRKYDIDKLINYRQTRYRLMEDRPGQLIWPGVDSIWPEVEKNLRYSFELIRPATLEEMAIVIATELLPASRRNIVDEYVIRREGGKPLLPDYEIFNLKKSDIMPDTQRIPFFEEQIRHVLHLCCADNVAPDEGGIMNLAGSFIGEYAEFDDFYEVTQPSWSENRRSKSVLRPVFYALKFYAPYVSDYLSCSLAAGRAYEEKRANQRLA